MAAGEAKKGDYGDILLAVVARLIDRIQGIGEANCYISLDPDTLPSNPSDTTYVVAPTTGNFREEMYVGGALEELNVEGGLIVKIHCPSLLDQKNRDTAAITHESLGLIHSASKVLRALAADDWQPLGEDAGFVMTAPLAPVSYVFTKTDGAVRSIELTFRCRFDWDTSR